MSSATTGMDGWLLLIVSIGTSTTVGGIVNAYLSRRKTNADVSEAMTRTGKTAAEITGVGASTAETQVTTSLAMLVEMRAEMVVLREDLAAARTEMAEMQRRWKKYTVLLEQHAVWDTEVVAVVRELGGVIGPPPPLHPEDGEGV